MNKLKKYFIRKKLEYSFEKLYKEATEILKEFNPCQSKIIEGNFSCIGKNMEGNNFPQCCCVGCPAWTLKGCSAEKPLTCRTWICHTAILHNKKAYKKLTELSNKVREQGFWVYRGDKQASINLAMKKFI